MEDKYMSFVLTVKIGFGIVVAVVIVTDLIYMLLKSRKDKENQNEKSE
jgi:hypothetical protein